MPAPISQADIPYGPDQRQKLDVFTKKDFTDAQSNVMVGGDPETPLFLAVQNDPIRFRIAKPGGNARNHVFQLHGHA